MSAAPPRGRVAAWAAWDWGSAAFNAVIVTFIYSVYLVDGVGAEVPGASAKYSWAMGAAGLAIAALAPVTGRRADLLGRRRASLGAWTLATVALMAALAVVRPEAGWFWPGVGLLAVATVTFQFAEVSYFAMLKQVSTPATVGRVSGIGWAAGYVGGIVLLLGCYLGFIAGEGPTRGLLGVPAAGGWSIRLVALVAAGWFLLAALPAMTRVPEIEPSPDAAAAPRPGPAALAAAYRGIAAELRGLWREDRSLVRFLVASAVFRDGLAGVFTFGAILAVRVYGIDAADVLLFGVAANVVAAAGSVAAGVADDRLGPRPVILGSLGAMCLVSVGLLAASGPAAFWVLGLALCLFVGPAQAASRSYLTRLTPAGREGQMFGLYATVGRAVSWLTPLAFGAFVAVFHADRAGVAGILLVLAAGMALMARVPNVTAAGAAG